MITRVLATGLLAGLLAGLAVAILQAFSTTPIILAAEAYEGGGHDHSAYLKAAPDLLRSAVYTGDDAPASIPVHSEAHSDTGAQSWMPGDGLERTVYTGIATIGTAIGLAMILLAGLLVAGDRITVRTALAWAAAGFVVTGLAPAAGLPPELPGMPAADLVSRQAWWFATAACTALALWLILRSQNIWLGLLGVAILLAPHVWGAPELAGEVHSDVPAHLAADFTAMSLAVHAALWAVTGFFVAFWWPKLAPKSS